MIVRIPSPNPLPTAQLDYVKQNTLTATGFLRVNDPWPVMGGNIVQGAVFQFGGTVYLCTAATAIAGVASNYVKITPDVDPSTASASYVANLIGVAWNSAYNGYYDVGGSLYVFDEARALQDGQIAAVVQKYITQNENADSYIGRDIRAGRDLVGKRNVDIKGDADGDHQIDFASDASLLWDESESRFIFNKEVAQAFEGSGTLANMWAAIQPFVPNIGDKRSARGGFHDGSNLFVLTMVWNSAAGTFKMYGIGTNGATIGSGAYNKMGAGAYNWSIAI